MRRIETQAQQWPQRVADVTGTEGMSALEAGTALGAGSGREQAAIGVAQSAAGKPYDWGGSGPGSTDASGKAATSWDCTGLAADEIKAYTGQDPSGSEMKGADGARFNTTSPMAATGLLPGNVPGGLNFALNPSPGQAGHIMSELPNGQQSESSGSAGVQYGDTKHDMGDTTKFTQQWHMPDATQTVVNQMTSPSDAGSSAANKS